MVKLLDRKYNIYLIACLGSIFFSILTLLYRQPFDVDGILYLHAASAFISGGFATSFQTFQWPFYSILIAVTAKTLHLSLLNSGYLLNSIFDLITVCTFIAIIKELGGSKKLQLLGTLLILTLPYFNHFRVNILRGHGYYAFALLSIYLLMRFATTRHWRHALTWSITMLFAALFRVEGIILFCLLPLALLFQPQKRLQTILQAYTLQIVLIITVSIILFIYTIPSADLGRIHSITSSTPLYIWHVLQAKHSIITTNIIGASTLEGSQASYFISGGIIGVVIGIILRSFGILYPALALYALTQKLLPWRNNSARIWIFALATNLLIGAAFFTKNFYISERYLALLYLLLLLSAPFAIQKIYQHWQEHKKTTTGSRWLFILILLMLAYTIIAGIGRFAPSKSYIIDSGTWLRNNMPPKAKLCCNDEQLLYYAGEQGVLISDTKQLLQQYKTKKCDYLAVKIPRHSTKSLKQLAENFPTKPGKEFGNRRGDKAFIFIINNHYVTKTIKKD